MTEYIEGKLRFASGLFILAFVMSACSSDTSDHSQESTLRISVLPDQKPAELEKKYKPLFDYISSETGLKYRLIIPKSYQSMLEDMKNNQSDLVYFGGYMFMLAHRKNLVQPLVMRDIDLKFSSSLIVSIKSDVVKISELHNKTLAFGSELSTSGHLMPRYFLRDKGINPEKYFLKVEYSGAHDKTAYLVRDGKVDAGILNSYILKRMISDGRLSEQDIRVIWVSPPYADYVWAISTRVKPDIASKLKKAFLQLLYSNPEHKKVLDNLSARTFYPASLDDFNILHTIVANDHQH